MIIPTPDFKRISSQVCRNFAHKQRQPVKFHAINDSSGEHIQILRSLNMVEYVRKVLYDEI